MQSSLFTFNFKQNIKRVGAILLLGVVITFIFGRYCKIVKSPRDSFYQFYNYIDDNMIDVLCVGSSHVWYGINPVQMYNDYGIAAFDLVNGSQGAWHSYYYIKEALKTQNPKIVILDVFTMQRGDEVYNDEVVKNNLLNMSISWDKWQALLVDGNAESKADIFWGFPITHTRYREVNKDDFEVSGNMDNFLGYTYLYDSIAEGERTPAIDALTVTDSLPVTEKTEKYLRKIIELCLNRGIDIILVNSPQQNITIEMQKKYNYIQEIADEYQILFLNGCLYNNEIGIDYTIDLRQDGHHMNYSGVTKYTKWLSDYLSKNYNLPDRRGNTQYEVWEYQAERLEAKVRKERLASLTDFKLILEEARMGKGLYYVVSLNGNYNNLSADEEHNILNTLASYGFNVEQNGTYVMKGQQIIFYSNDESGYQFYKYFGNSVLYLYEENNYHMIQWDGIRKSMVYNGVNIVVYDECLDEIVGTYGFDVNNILN